jgi:hypothetical protein
VQIDEATYTASFEAGWMMSDEQVIELVENIFREDGKNQSSTRLPAASGDDLPSWQKAADEHTISLAISERIDIHMEDYAFCRDHHYRNRAFTG